MDAVRELLKKAAMQRTPKDVESGLPKRYVAGLTAQERKKQISEIERVKQVYQKTGKVVEREKLGVSKRSPFVIAFEKRYGFPITDLAKVKKEFPGTDVNLILAKGRAAFASSGSRPGQTPDSWAFSRLASVLVGGKALGIDKDLVSDNDLKKILSK